MIRNHNTTKFLVIVVLCCLISFSFSFTPDSTVSWAKCTEQTPIARRLSEETETDEIDNVITKMKSTITKVTDDMSQEDKERRELVNSLVTQLISDRYLNKNEEQSTTESMSGIAYAQCTTIKVPLLWRDANNAEFVKFFVKKFKAKKANPIGQVWLLSGGPGMPGTEFDTLAATIRDDLDNQYDIMVPDYRGTGRSTNLNCKKGDPTSSTIDKVKACWDNLDQRYPGKLDAWSTTSIAKDIYHAFTITRNNNAAKLVIYSLSYGTYVANRFTTLYPNVADVTIFDSVVPTSIDMNERSDHFLEAGSLFIEVCKTLEGCNQKFSAEYNQTVDEMFATVFAQQNEKSLACVGSIYTPAAMSRFFAGILKDKDLRRLIFPVIYRLRRCNAKDKNWLVNLGVFVEAYTFASTLSVTGPAPSSNTIFTLLVTSELTRYPVNYTEEYWDDKFSTFPPYFDAGFSQQFTRNSLAFGYRRYNDSLVDLYPDGTHTKPVLTIHGGLDAQTPVSFANEWNEHYNATNNYFILMPNSVHACITSTPLPKKEGYCGLKIIVEFIQDPTQEPSRSCLSTMEDAVYDYDLCPSYLRSLTGSSDLWEKGPKKTFRKSLLTIIGIVTGVVVFPCLLCFIFTLFMFIGLMYFAGSARGKRSDERSLLKSLSGNPITNQSLHSRRTENP